MLPKLNHAGAGSGRRSLSLSRNDLSENATGGGAGDVAYSFAAAAAPPTFAKEEFLLFLVLPLHATLSSPAGGLSVFHLSEAFFVVAAMIQEQIEIEMEPLDGGTTTTTGARNDARRQVKLVAEKEDADSSREEDDDGVEKSGRQSGREEEEAPVRREHRTHKLTMSVVESKTWREVFYQLAEMDGEVIEGCEPSINIAKLREHFRKESSYNLEKMTGLPRYRLMYILGRASKLDLNRDGHIVLSEWQAYLGRWAGGGGDRERVLDRGVSGGVLRVLVYAPTYNVSPPSVFLFVLTVIQVVCFVLSIQAPHLLGIHPEFGQNTWPTDSELIYDPIRRKQVWRFFTYIFLHASYQHLVFNCLMQLTVGIPLELSQVGWLGSFRVALLYLLGVLLGSLGASVVEPQNYILGASPGVYALIAAHVATLILNWNEDGKLYNDRMGRSVAGDEDLPPAMALNPCVRAFRLALVLVFTIVDVGQAIFQVFYLKTPSSTGYSSHFFGALSGLVVGIFLLENRKVEDWEVKFRRRAQLGFFLMMAVFVAWHVVGSFTGWFPRQYG